MDEHLSTIVSQEFLENCIKTPVVHYTVSPGSKPGDNFMSCLYALEVKSGDEERTEHMLLKTYPKDEAFVSFLCTTNFFYKEIEFYTVLLPEYQRFISESLENSAFELPFPNIVAGKALNWWKRQYDSQEDIELDHNFLLMTDARKTHGYRMADRQEGFDFDHLKLVIEAVAKLHATSWAYKQKEGIRRMSVKYPFLIDTLVDQKMMNLDTSHPIVEAMKTVIIPSLEVMKKGFAEGEKSKIFRAVNKLCGDADAAVRKAFAFIRPEGIDEAEVESWLRVPPEPIEKYQSEPWLVTVHGDIWVNNTLFTYDAGTGKPTKVMLVDLQLVGEACPTVEFARLFFTSVKPEIRQRHLKECIQLYHDKFLYYCQLLKTEPLPGFNMATLSRRYRRLQIDGIILTLSLLNLALSPSPPPEGKAPKMEKPKSLIDIFRHVTNANMNNDILIQRLCETATELYEDGVI